MFDFSIIIPVYNRPDYLKDAVYSCLNQDYSNYEIIVVDDGSPIDNLKSVVESVENPNNIKLSYYRINNSGAGYARNFGVSKSSGKYIVFLDSDDILVFYSLKLYNDTLRKFHFPSVVVASRIKFKNYSDIDKSKFLDLSEYIVRYLSFKNYFCKTINMEFGASNIIVNRKSFQSVGGFHLRSQNTEHAEDHDLLLKLGDQPGFVYIVNPSSVYYRIHDSNSVANIDRLLYGLKELINSENLNLYPGGRTYLLQRYSIIGTPIFHWVIKLIKLSSFNKAIKLFISSFSFVIVFVILNCIYKIKNIFDGK